MLRPPTAPVITRFEELGGELYQENREIWEASVRAWYSRRIAGEVTPALEDLNPARIGRIRSLILDLWGEGNGKRCLDFCCGSGLGSLVLRDLGYDLLSCDNDESLLSLGFSTGRLLPEETMCIDATCADSYIRKTDLGLGLMFGEINRFNTDVWEQITGMLVSLTHRSLVTTGTKEEAALIAAWADEAGACTEIMEYDGDPLYDRWVCSITEA
jgi:SAM-dependent methyltransferase